MSSFAPFIKQSIASKPNQFHLDRIQPCFAAPAKWGLSVQRSAESVFNFSSLRYHCTGLGRGRVRHGGGVGIKVKVLFFHIPSRSCLLAGWLAGSISFGVVDTANYTVKLLTHRTIKRYALGC